MLVDEEASKKIRAVEHKIKKKMKWKGSEELEELCNMFVVQLTAPSGMRLEPPTPKQNIAAEPKSPTKLDKVIKEDMDEDEPDADGGDDDKKPTPKNPTPASGKK